MRLLLPTCFTLGILSLLPMLGCRPAASEAPAGARGEPELELDGGEGSGPTARWSYTIQIDEALATMNLGLCIEGPRPRRLISAGEGLPFVSSARVRGGPALAREGQSLTIETLGEQGCVDLEIDLERATRASDRSSARRQDTIMLGPDRWLWYPSVVPEGLEARARLDLAPGVAATLPWPELEPGDPKGWRSLDRTSFGWNAWAGFGHYEPLRFTAAACEFEVAVLAGPRKLSDAGIERWLSVAAEAVAQLYGRFPRDRVSVVVIPSAAWGSSPVVFGMARRGGGGSVMLLVNESARDDELPGEWVAIHELLHLGMPLVAEPWMSEGFVTYYTQVVRARAGLFKAEDQARAALEALASGFAGRRGSRSLESASASMRQQGAYRQVYWGGAALAFDLDLSIRSASQNRRSLDDLMLMLWSLAPEHRRFAAEDLFARMDALLGRWQEAGELSREISPSSIAARHLGSKSPPAEIQTLRGVAVDFGSGNIRLLPNPIDQVQVRTGLFAPKEQRSSAPTHR